MIDAEEQANFRNSEIIKFFLSLNGQDKLICNFGQLYSRLQKIRKRCKKINRYLTNRLDRLIIDYDILNQNSVPAKYARQKEKYDNEWNDLQTKIIVFVPCFQCERCKSGYPYESPLNFLYPLIKERQ